MNSLAPVAQQPHDIRLAELIQHVHTYSITTKSDLSREYADEIAKGASLGMLTTQIVPGSRKCGRRWKVTPTGLYFLANMASTIEGQEVAAYEARYEEQGEDSKPIIEQ